MQSLTVSAVNPKEIVFPENIGETEATVIGDLIVFVTIDHDEYSEDPTTWDATGKMYSFSRRHGNFLKGFDFPPTSKECREKIIKEYGHDVVFLGYYEHGQCSWFVEGYGAPGTECRWDGVQFAGFWLPDKELLKQAQYHDKLKKGTEARYDKMVEWAKQACALYTSWCNGEVYCYSIKAYKVRREGEETYKQLDDYRYADELAEESCCGYYGDDITTGVEEGVKNILQSLHLKGLICKLDIS